MQVEIALTPADVALLPARDLRAATCVVFDVLRATSTILTALAHGARRIYPVTTVDEARTLRQTSLPDALLGGERHGTRLPGFDLGNSPREYGVAAVQGRDVIMTTTNGTVALQACAGAARVHAGALLNLAALATALTEPGATPELLVLVCAGSGEHFALEDGLAAAALLERLKLDAAPSDAGRLLQALYGAWGADPLAALRASSNGRRLAEIGLGADVEDCARVSELETVAVMQDGALQRWQRAA